MFTKKEAELIKENFEIKPVSFQIIDMINDNEKQVKAKQEIIIKTPTLNKLRGNYLDNFIYEMITKSEMANSKIEYLGDTIYISFGRQETLNSKNKLVEYAKIFAESKNEMFKNVEELLKMMLLFIDIRYNVINKYLEYEANFDIDEHTEKDEKYFTIVNPQDMNETKLKM